MQKVANEMHLSETAFLVPQGDSGSSFDLRWFTPTDEVDLCGHATLASSHVLWEVHGCDESVPLEFHTRSGLLTATRSADGSWIELNFPSEPAAPVAADSPDRAQLLMAFPNLKDADLLFVGRNKIGGPGGGDVIVEVPIAALHALEVVLSEAKKVVCRVLSVTAQGGPAHPPPGRATSDYDFISRSFAPCVGVDEDPVCGSAHCMLGPYWQQRTGKAQLMARAASLRGGDVRVRVEGERTVLGGQAVTTVVGSLLH